MTNGDDWPDLFRIWHQRAGVDPPPLHVLRQLERKDRIRLALIGVLQLLSTGLVLVGGVELWRWHRDPFSLAWLVGCAALVGAAWALGLNYLRGYRADLWTPGDQFFYDSVIRCRRRLRLTNVLLILLVLQSVALFIWYILRLSELALAMAQPSLILRVVIGAGIAAAFGIWLWSMRSATRDALEALMRLASPLESDLRDDVHSAAEEG